jgi:hypothetical protein
MKTIFFIIFIGLTVSCLHDRAYHTNFISWVKIDSISIPLSSEVLTETHITAVAVANNGCWKKLHFRMTQKDTFDYEIKAFGTYESYGACPEVMVYQDTIIRFIPPVKGKYLFHTTIEPNNVRIDTMLVN